MKTVKITLLITIIALLVYSCSSDREDEVNNPSQSPVKLDLNKFKTNNKMESVSKIGDTLKGKPLNNPNGSTGPQDPNYDTGENPIVDPTKPDKPW